MELLIAELRANLPRLYGFEREWGCFVLSELERARGPLTDVSDSQTDPLPAA